MQRFLLYIYCCLYVIGEVIIVVGLFICGLSG